MSIKNEDLMLRLEPTAGHGDFSDYFSCRSVTLLCVMISVDGLLSWCSVITNHPIIMTRFPLFYALKVSPSVAAT